MKWKDLEKRIRIELIPGHRGILKCRGNARCAIVSNDGQTIGMRTGVETDSAHTISYEMIKYAFERLNRNKTFDSQYFRLRFSQGYQNATCRYSMVGGTLVEVGVARRHPKGNSCYYTRCENSKIED